MAVVVEAGVGGGDGDADGDAVAGQGVWGILDGHFKSNPIPISLHTRVESCPVTGQGRRSSSLILLFASTHPARPSFLMQHGGKHYNTETRHMPALKRRHSIMLELTMQNGNDKETYGVVAVQLPAGPQCIIYRI